MTKINKNFPKVAIVTGISRGFGKAVAKSLLSAGWQVVGDGRDPKLLRKTILDLKANGIVQGVSGDVTSELHLSKLVEMAASLGNLRLIVNNAGTLGPSPLPTLSNLKIDDLEVAFRTNTLAPLRLIQLTLHILQKSKGVVINITSDAAAEDYPKWGAYSATKIALEKLTSILAIEEPKVRFYSLDPGDMRTDMHQAAYPKEDISDRPEPEVSSPAVVKLAQGTYPSGRYRAADILSGKQR